MSGHVVTSGQIQELREKTGVGIAKCKEALLLSHGDMEKAVDHLRKLGMTAGVKKEGREAKEGEIVFRENDRSLVLLEVDAETDFVVQNERFARFAADVVDQVLASGTPSLEKLWAQPYAKDPSITVDVARNLLIQALGENIQLSRLQVIHKKAHSSYGIYSHMGGKLVVVVEIEGASDEQAVAREIGMHIAAESPDYLTMDEIPQELIDRETEIARSQVQGKPEQIVEKIVAGKIKAFGEQVCLLSQKYVKDSSLTVAEFLASYAKTAGKSLTIRSFLRWKVGQA